MSVEQTPRHRFDGYDELLPHLTEERLGSYLAATDGDIRRAFHLYEWNMRAASSVMELTSMIEVVVRNALDHELRSWASLKQPGSEWFDIIPLDRQGALDLRKARGRATRNGARPEVHGRVIAELPLGFWRYLVETRYLTALWVPATHAAFPGAPADLRERQRSVKSRMQQLHFVRNRAAHHEPIHQRSLEKDLHAALDLAEWVSPTTAAWVRAAASLPDVIARKPHPDRP